VSYLYGGAVCLVAAQVLGIYALVSRKADLVFSLCMVMLLVAAFALGAYGAYAKLA
jgi:hypothetical protein